MNPSEEVEIESPYKWEGEHKPSLEEGISALLCLIDLTYTSAVPSTFGVTDEKNIRGCFQQRNQRVGNNIAKHWWTYNLRSSARMQCRTAAVTTIFDKMDNPTLSKALNCNDCKKWMQAVTTERDVVVNNGTRQETRGKQSNTKPLRLGFALRIKRDIKRKVIMHKTRLVVRGHFQTDVAEPAEL